MTLKLLQFQVFMYNIMVLKDFLKIYIILIVENYKIRSLNK